MVGQTEKEVFGYVLRQIFYGIAEIPVFLITERQKPNHFKPNGRALPKQAENCCLQEELRPKDD
jgi:hypothetical protein